MFKYLFTVLFVGQKTQAMIRVFLELFSTSFLFFFGTTLYSSYILQYRISLTHKTFAYCVYCIPCILNCWLLYCIYPYKYIDIHCCEPVKRIAALVRKTYTIGHESSLTRSQKRCIDFQ